MQGSRGSVSMRLTNSQDFLCDFLIFDEAVPQDFKILKFSIQSFEYR